MPGTSDPLGGTDETDCLVMLQQGQVDAISTDDAILLGPGRPGPEHQDGGPAFSSEPYGMAISKAHPDFTFRERRAGRRASERHVDSTSTTSGSGNTPEHDPGTASGEIPVRP